jgi:hypothetical protein
MNAGGCLYSTESCVADRGSCRRTGGTNGEMVGVFYQMAGFHRAQSIPNSKFRVPLFTGGTVYPPVCYSVSARSSAGLVAGISWRALEQKWQRRAKLPKLSRADSSAWQRWDCDSKSNGTMDLILLVCNSPRTHIAGSIASI